MAPLTLTCLAPSPLACRPFAARRSSRQQRRPFRALASLGDKQPAEAPLPDPAEEKDFFEGEGWDVAGKVLSGAVPVFIVLAVLIGAFAASTYNEGATVFLDSPKSLEDTAKFYSVVD